MSKQGKTCYVCGEKATGLAWRDGTYYFACHSHETSRPVSVPRALLVEAVERLHGERGSL